MSEQNIRLWTSEDSTEHVFTLAQSATGRSVSIANRPWEPGDKKTPFRIPLHPWTGGLYVNRINTRTTYAKANADASNDGLLLHPPKVNEITFENGTTTQAITEFAGSIFVLRDQYVYEIDPSDYSATLDRTLPAAGVDMVVFNNELFVAMGDAEKIWRRDSSGTWTQATDDTFAIALGVVGTQLWRGESPNLISSCFPGTTVVALTPDIRRIYRRWYEGDVVTIRTASGNELTGTPNHPIRTTRGWIALGDLRKGDCVISAGWGEQIEGVNVPDVENVHAALEQIFNLAMLVGGRAQRVPSLGVDFHGDGREGYVDVIATDGDLMSRILSTLLQPLNDETLAAPLQPLGSLMNDGLSRQLGVRANAATTSNGGDRPGPSRFGRGSGIPCDLCVAVGTDCYALLPQHRCDCHVANPEPSGEGHGVLGPLGVGCDGVVDLVKSPFSGYVFNLETGTGEYVAENIVTHNCTSQPLTLTSWVPASPNQYKAGDSTHEISTIIDYGGIPWVGKPDGMYAPDPQTRFLNQTPQIKQWPDDSNTVGAFTGQGVLWVPSEPGLLRVQPGSSRPMGPELTARPNYRFSVKGGVEFGGVIYLLVNCACGGHSFICKMLRNQREITPLDYIYHEWVRLGNGAGNVIAISTLPTNPTIFVEVGDVIKYVKLGRGGGRDIDDEDYEYGTSMEIETGIMVPGSDRTIVSQPVGVQVTLDYSRAGDSLTIYGRTHDHSNDNYIELLEDQENASTGQIAMTDDIEAVRRYFPPGVAGQHVEVKFESTLTSASGTDRPEIYEAWLFGFLHPKKLDVITARIVTGSHSQWNGKTREEIIDWFRRMDDRGEELILSLADYEEYQTVRVVVDGVRDVEVFATAANVGGGVEAESAIEVDFIRVDHAGGYARGDS